MEGKVVLVTGATSGIGESVAYLFATKGYSVAVHGRNPEAVNRVVTKCDILSREKRLSMPLFADFSKIDEVVSMIDKVIARYGRLDVLINNAGMYKRTAALIPQTLNLYNEVMQINTTATVNLTSKAIEHIMKVKGNIVFVSSVGSFKPEPYGYAYCMSKAAISMYAKCLAQELAPRVRVNVVCPGVTRTNIFLKAGIEMDMMIDYFNATNLLGRVATPEEIAKSVYFLASDESSYTTGECLVVDGGYCMNTTNLRDSLRKSPRNH